MLRLSHSGEKSNIDFCTCEKNMLTEIIFEAIKVTFLKLSEITTMEKSHISSHKSTSLIVFN